MTEPVKLSVISTVLADDPAPFAKFYSPDPVRQLIIVDYDKHLHPWADEVVTKLSRVFISEHMVSHLLDALSFATARNLLWDDPNSRVRLSLGDGLKYLNANDDIRRAVVLSGKDGQYGFSLSAYVWRSSAWAHSYNGGLLYYGSGDSGVGGPNFSVRIGSVAEGWNIHT